MSAFISQPQQTYQYKPYFHTPSIAVVEHALYVSLREELDAIHNFVLPQSFPRDHLLRVHYHKGAIHVIAFPETKRWAPRQSKEVSWNNLAAHRSWYFRWGGNGIGPIRIPANLVALFEGTSAGMEDNPREKKHTFTLLEEQQRYMDSILYVPLA